MNENIPNKSNFVEELKDLHRLHLVTKDFKHIIEYEPGSWKMFEPSKFIYSYFAFNSFYNFDWNKSCENYLLTSIDKIIKDNVEVLPYEADKYKAMIDFIFKYTSVDDRKIFIQYMKRPNKRENPLTDIFLIESIEGIVPDKKITESDCESFKKVFIKLVVTEELLIGRLKEIVRFVYLVRNNIFHGTKTTIEMTDKNQRKRLEIYSNILIATNELLFRSLANNLKIKFDGHYKLNLDDKN
jgi:hypothetical protein